MVGTGPPGQLRPKETVKKNITTLITRALFLAASLAAVLVPATAAQAHQTPKTKRVSVKSNGQEINVDNDFGASVSANGRYVAFPSQGKYTHGDGGSDYDVFVHDRLTGKTRRASLKSNGKEVDGQDCLNHSISANGNMVAFTCDGAMVGSDNNGYPDVYVKNMSSGKIVRASVKSDGSEIPAASGLPSISADGRYVAFVTDGALVGSDTNGVEDIYRHDLKTGKTTGSAFAPTAIRPIRTAPTRASRVTATGLPSPRSTGR